MTSSMLSIALLIAHCRAFISQSFFSAFFTSRAEGWDIAYALPYNLPRTAKPRAQRDRMKTQRADPAGAKVL